MAEEKKNNFKNFMRNAVNEELEEREEQKEMGYCDMADGTCRVDLQKRPDKSPKPELSDEIRKLAIDSDPLAQRD